MKRAFLCENQQAVKVLSNYHGDTFNFFFFFDLRATNICVGVQNLQLCTLGIQNIGRCFKVQFSFQSDEKKAFG